MGHRVWDQVVTLNVGFMERLLWNRCAVALRRVNGASRAKPTLA